MYLRPLPQGQGSLRPAFISRRRCPSNAVGIARQLSYAALSLAMSRNPLRVVSRARLIRGQGQAWSRALRQEAASAGARPSRRSTNDAKRDNSRPPQDRDPFRVVLFGLVIGAARISVGSLLALLNQAFASHRQRRCCHSFTFAGPLPRIGGPGENQQMDVPARHRFAHPRRLEIERVLAIERTLRRSTGAPRRTFSQHKHFIVERDHVCAGQQFQHAGPAVYDWDHADRGTGGHEGAAARPSMSKPLSLLGIDKERAEDADRRARRA